MGYVWVVWMAAALGQTTQPAEADISHAPTTQPTTAVRAEQPATRPADAPLDRLFSALNAATDKGEVGFDLGQLSGNPVDIDVTADGTIILYGDEKDVAILEEFIRQMDEQPIFEPVFRIIQLESADATDLAQKVQQLWERSHQPTRAPVRPEDRITIIPEARANLLLVAATEENIEAILEIIRQLDQPSLGELVTFEDVQLHNIKAAEAEAILKEMLDSLMQRRGAQRDLVTIQANPRLNMLLINAPPEDLAQIKEWIKLIDVEPRAETGGVVTLAFFPLERARANDVSDALIEMLQPEAEMAEAIQEQIRRLRTIKRLPDGSEQELSELNLEKPIKIIPEQGSNAIIVATVKENLQPVGEIIAMLDAVPLAGEVVVNIFPLDHADAEQLADNLRDVFQQGSDLMEQPGKPDIEGRVPPGLTGEALAYPIGVTADKRTNTVIVSGRAEQILLIKQIVKAVDVEPEVGRFAPRLVRLEHASVSSIADAVQQVADQRQAVLEQTAGATAAERQRTLIIPDVRTNSLIIVATDENYEEVAGLARQLDGAEDDWLGQIRILTLVEDLAATEVADRIRELWERRAELRRQGGLEADLPVIVADTRSNSLVIASSKEDFTAIEAVVAKLKGLERAPMADIRLIPVTHADVSQLAEVLRELWDERMQMSLAEGQKEQPSERIAIVEDVVSRTLLVASSKANFDELQGLVAKLDTEPSAEGLYRAFKLTHADPEEAADFLQDLFSQGLYVGSGDPANLPESAKNVTVVADPRTGLLVVSGSPQNLTVVESLLEQIDREGWQAIAPPRLIKLANASVQNIVDVVEQLIEQRQEVAETVLSPQAAQRERPMVIGDVRTNTLIVIAKDEYYQEIVELAQRLDSAEEDWLGQIHIVNLTNLTATDLASKIEDLWERRAQLRREGGLPEDKPVIVADTRSNSLVIASQPNDYEAILQLVNKLEAQKLAPMADIRLITLEHNDPAEMSNMLQDLWEARVEQSLAEGQKEQPADRVTIVDDPMTRTLLVVSSKSNFEEIQRLVKQLDVPPVVDGLYRVFFVRNADITKAAELIQDLFDEGLYTGRGDAQTLPEWATKVTVVPDLRSSALIVSASPQNLTIVESLIEEIDREDIPALPSGARFFPLRHADVVQVADMLERMFEGMQESMASEQRDQLEAQFIPDSRSRVLIVTGARLALRRAEELVPELDRESPAAAYEMKVYPLEQASASKLEPIMTDLFEERMTQEQAGERTPIHIIADDGSNTLIVTASPEDHKMVEHLVGLLDRASTIAEQMHVIRLEHAKAEPMADMLESLMEEQQGDARGGFTIVPEPRTNALLVWASPDLLRNIRTIVTELDNTRPKAEMAMRVFKLRNAKAEDLADLLDEFFEKAGAGEGDETRQMIINFGLKDPVTGNETPIKLVHQDVTISPDPHTNSLMVLAPEKHIHMVGMMIEMLDSVEPQTADLRIFPLRNADASRMQDLLEDLFQTTRGEDGRPQLVFAGGDAGPAMAGSTGAVELAFSVDERTNSLIAAGSPSYLKIVERLVFELDRYEMEDRIARVTHLRNRKPEDVASAMQAYFEEESRVLREAAEGEAALRQLQRTVVIEPGGEGSSALMMRYDPRMEAEVLNVLSELDRAPAMVMIQVLIAEVTLDDRFELGMEFALQDLSFSKKAVVNPDTGIVTGPNHDFIAGTDIGATGESSLGGFTFTMTSEDFNFLFRALQVEGRLEVLSRPAIMVQDNQEAAITIGERVPTVQNVVVSAAGVVTPSVSYEDVGVILKVTPIVNPDGYVSMEIAPEISSIGTSSISIGSGVTLPTFTERSAETTVTVKDGETIIIGGLITSRENQSENKVPLLGDVPMLGNLFRAKVDTSTRTELLFVLTPRVVRTPEDARKLAIDMRDQTGMLENIRKSPLMGNLQVHPEDEPFGPHEMLEPTGQEKPRIEGPAPMGPEIEELGPPLSSIEIVRPNGEAAGEVPPLETLPGNESKRQGP